MLSATAVTPTLFHEKNGPRKIYMYIYLKAVSSIDCINQSFVVQFHQYLQWAPTKLEFDDYNADPTTYRPAFIPSYPPSNAREVEFSDEEKKVGSKNPLHLLTHGSTDIWGEEVTSIAKDQVLFGISHKYRVSISCPMNLHNFPYDIQSLHLFFESLNSTAEVLLYPCFIKESCIEMELGTMASSPEYKFHTPTIEFASFGDPPRTYSCCTLTIKCSRKWHGFVWRVIYPLASLTLFSLAAFFYEITDFSSRLSFLITLILSIIAFQFVVMSSIPPIPYVSQADIYVIQSLGFLSCIILYVCIIQKYLVISASDPSYVQLIDARFGIAFSAAWVLMQSIYFLQARSKYLKSLPLLTMSYSELMDQELLAAPYELLSLPSKSVRILYEEVEVEDIDKDEDKEKEKEVSASDASGITATTTISTQLEQALEQALAKAKIIEIN